MQAMKKVSLIALLLVTVTSAVAPVSGTTSCPSSGVKAVSTTTGQVATYTLQAPSGNMGSIYIGTSSVTSTGGGIYLAAKDTYTAQPKGNSSGYNLGSLYMACSNSSDSLNWIGQ